MTAKPKPDPGTYADAIEEADAADRERRRQQALEARPFVMITDTGSQVTYDRGGTQAQRLSHLLGGVPVHRICGRLYVMRGSRPVLDVTDVPILTMAQSDDLIDAERAERFAPLESAPDPEPDASDDRPPSDTMTQHELDAVRSAAFVDPAVKAWVS